MKYSIQIVIKSDDASNFIKEVFTVERKDTTTTNLGLTLAESKDITANISREIIEEQVKKLLKAHESCEQCNKPYKMKDNSCNIVYRTLFGKVKIRSPRLFACDCHLQGTKTFSPIAKTLSNRTSPELEYLETKWASLMSYGMTVKLLGDVLPVEANTSSVYRNIHNISEKLENALGKEKYSYIDGCPYQWGNLPNPGKPLIVGMDGGYVHARDGANRKAGWFEVIVGKCLQNKQEPKRFGFVPSFDVKPKRKVYETLMNCGLQMNQQITFFSDGAENLRDLQQYLSPQSEHILDWFHITMRITVMFNMLKSLAAKDQEVLTTMLESIKWSLWHGNMFRAEEYLEDIFNEVEPMSKDLTQEETKFWKHMHEFDDYITSNKHLIANYADRHRCGETVSTAFVESAVNELISKRMSKKQQMRWTKQGAHMLLQTRIKTLNNELKEHFYKWYPDMQPILDQPVKMAA